MCMPGVSQNSAFYILSCWGAWLICLGSNKKQGWHILFPKVARKFFRWKEEKETGGWAWCHLNPLWLTNPRDFCYIFGVMLKVETFFFLFILYALEFDVILLSALIAGVYDLMQKLHFRNMGITLFLSNLTSSWKLLSCCQCCSYRRNKNLWLLPNCLLPVTRQSTIKEIFPLLLWLFKFRYAGRSEETISETMPLLTTAAVSESLLSGEQKCKKLKFNRSKSVKIQHLLIYILSACRIIASQKSKNWVCVPRTWIFFLFKLFHSYSVLKRHC